MDYEQKYKEALKVIEGLYNVVKYQSSSDALLTCQTIEKAFPELKESEDEKIRKAIIEFVRQSSEVLSKQNQNNMIAWLEKQGEKESKEIDFADWDTLNYIKDIVREHVKKDEEFNEIDNWLTTHYQEQNPAWSEEDERMLGKCIDAASGYYSLEDKQNIKDWLRAIKDRIQPQPKQEWNEEDERMLKSIIYCIDGTPLLDSDQIDWLKSLKPRWKPTENQISMLLAVVNDGNNANSESCHIVLKSLYNDLKSL